MVSIDVTLETTAQVAGTQNDLTLSGPLQIVATAQGKPSCHVNPDIDKNGTSFAFQPSGCTPGVDCTGMRALVLALDNVTPIPTNSVLYTCDIEIATDTSGTFPLACSNSGAGDPDGNKLGTDCTDGMITVAAAADATIVVGSVTGAAGDFESLDVTLQTAVQVVSTENDITFPAGQAAIAAGSDGKPICAVNSAINKTATFEFQPTGCSVGSTCTGIVATVSDTGTNSPITGGSRLYTCQVSILESAANGTYPLTCSNPSAHDPEGGSLVAACVDGSVVVGVQPTPTDTPTNTPTPTGQTGGTPSATPTPPPTSTSTSGVPPTPTRRLHFADSDSCQIVGAAESRPALILLLPVALLLAVRRRRR
jgi:hypothetical protein